MISSPFSFFSSFSPIFFSYTTLNFSFVWFDYYNYVFFIYPIDWSGQLRYEYTEMLQSGLLFEGSPQCLSRIWNAFRLMLGVAKSLVTGLPGKLFGSVVQSQIFQWFLFFYMLISSNYVFSWLYLEFFGYWLILILLYLKYL